MNSSWAIGKGKKKKTKALASVFNRLPTFFLLLMASPGLTSTRQARESSVQQWWRRSRSGGIGRRRVLEPKDLATNQLRVRLF